MIIRKFQGADAENLSRMINYTIEKSNSRDYTREEIERLFLVNTPEILKKEAKKMLVFVAEKDGEIVGTISLSTYRTKNEAEYLIRIGEIKRNYVKPECQGQAIGRRLYERIESEAKKLNVCGLDVAASLTSIGFYEKMGFKREGEISKSPPLKTRFLLMTKDLD